jgi:hypothetical protein
MFLSPDILRAWTGTPFRKGQLQQLADWGYKRGKDFWIRRNGSLSVKAELLHSKVPVLAPAEPDFSALGPQATQKPASAATRLHPARALSTAPQGRPCANV